MGLIFIRHGHGEHLLKYPSRLNTLHPGLTDYGRMQVDQLKEHITLLSNDLDNSESYEAYNRNSSTLNTIL